MSSNDLMAAVPATDAYDRGYYVGVYMPTPRLGSGSRAFESSLSRSQPSARPRHISAL
jgi:hypothetical protein